MALTQITSKSITDGTIATADLADNAVTNDKVNASAAIAGTKIAPDFGSQNIVTTGSITANDLEIDSGTLSVDATNNQVGIGTTSISRGPLHIHNSSGTANIHITNNDTGTGTQDGATLFVADTSAGLWYREAYPLRFASNNTERMRIDSSGNVGIGADDPDQKLVVRGSGTTILKVENSDDGLAQLTLGNTGSSNLNLRQQASDFLMAIGGTDRVKVFNSGEITGYRQSNGNVFQYRRVTTSLFVIDNLSNESNTRIRIRNPGGQINYNSSSDYRLKENDVKITDGITRLKKLRPITFKWKSGTNTYDGFFAHEVSEACPTAVDGTKDEVDSNGDPVYQGIDHGKMVPLLTAALQEAIAKIEVLETKVAALEAK